MTRMARTRRRFTTSTGSTACWVRRRAWSQLALPPEGHARAVRGAALQHGAALLRALQLGARPISEGLKNRKQTLLRGMEESAKMRRDAEAQLEGYELKLERIEDELERVKKEMQTAGELEQKRVLGEARERRQRMERDARQLVEQELKAVRDKLLRETVESAVSRRRRRCRAG